MPKIIQGKGIYQNMRSEMGKDVRMRPTGLTTFDVSDFLSG